MTRLLAASLAVLLGGAVACAGPGSDERKLSPHTERNGPSGSVPAGLGEFYGQELSWGPCREYATTSQDRAAFESGRIECARVRVPMDYAAPKGRTITLGLLRKPATDRANRIGSLLVNPGGPGGSGMSAAASLAVSLEGTELSERFDLVGFDPRGIAASRPQVHCLIGAERDAERLDSDADASPPGVAQTEAENQDYARRCAERTGPEMLAHVGTRDVVKDMDVLRSVLGDKKLTYLGYSYGTRIGSEYAEEFPRSVRAMVLDGAIDPSQNTVEALVSQGAGFQRAFDDFAAWCTAKQQCALGSDPRQAVEVFQQLTRPLVEHPADAGNGRELSYSDATTGATQALYAPELWEQLNIGLRQLSQGEGRLLLALADVYFGREPSGAYSSTTDAFDAIRCVDDQRVTDPAEIQEADRRYREVAPFLDDGHPPNLAKDVCAFWRVPVTGEPSQPKVNGIPPTLVISTTGDPATPYRAGVELAAALRGRLLTFDGTQHTVFLQGNPCVDNAGIEYLVDATLPPKDTRCAK